MRPSQKPHLTDITMDNYLTVSAVGEDAPKVNDAFTVAVRDCGCMIIEARIARLGNNNALVMLLGGSWDAIAKVETSLTRLAEQHKMKIFIERTKFPNTAAEYLPYAIEIVAVQHIDTMHAVVSFLTQRQAIIADLNCHTYTTNRTETQMMQLQIAVDLPADTSIATIRGDFMDFCDQLNLDAIMEPAK
jgi:glycine cleavage system transcriptional repressor